MAPASLLERMDRPSHDGATLPQIGFRFPWEDASWEDVSLEDTLTSLFLLSGGGDSDFGDAEATYLDLPAGRAARLDILGGWPDGASVYVLKRGDTLVWLVCPGPDPLDDRWLSIVESFEFLAAEE